MKVRIDPSVCMGDSNCVKVCPEVFGYDDDAMQGKVLVEEVPPELEDKVRQAAAECNTRAIEVEE